MIKKILAAAGIVRSRNNENIKSPGTEAQGAAQGAEAPGVDVQGSAQGSEAPAISERVWQIDALRGAAIILMTIFHALVDIRDFFGFADVRYFEPPLSYIGRTSAILFIFISGVSCRFSKNNIARGVKVLLCGMLVTLATFFAVRDLYIRFGILHFLGASMILAGLIEKLIKKEKSRQAFMWMASPLSLAIGRIFAQVETELPFLFVVGITTASFISYDYYPIFPWICVFFAGYACGLFAVNNRKKLSSMRKFQPAPALCALGRVSLIFYLLHQPALIALFFCFDALRRIALNL